MIYPVMTENTEKETIMYFALEGKKPSELMDEIEKTYACCSSLKAVKKDGADYVAVTLDAEEEA